LKLPQLLSQFLYQTRKLDLPGIGSFTLDPEVVIPQESDRIGQMPASGIHFKNANIPVADDALVIFIKEHTGKMKSLAASDLDFHLTTGRQLLNIGKPFYLDGIGTLLKNKDGRLDFTPGEYLVARLENAGPERRSSFDEPPREREARNNSTRQGLLLLLIVVGLGIIGWGGYYLYKRNSFTEPGAEKQAVVVPDSTAKTDTAAGRNKTDTGAASKTAVQPGAGTADAHPAATSPAPAPVPAVTAPGTIAANVPGTARSPPVSLRYPHYRKQTSCASAVQPAAGLQVEYQDGSERLGLVQAVFSDSGPCQGYGLYQGFIVGYLRYSRV
jgi:hypothetical protein